MMSTEEKQQTETEMLVLQAINLLSPLTHAQRDVVIAKLIEERAHWFDRPYILNRMKKEGLR